MDYKLAIVGIGTVGQGLLEILVSKQDDLRKRYNAEFTVVAIADKFLGSVYDSKGIDPQSILDQLNEKKSLNDLAGESNGWDAIQTITDSNADILVEASYTDLETGEPAMTHFKKALETGKHIVTTNKGPILLAYGELKKLADSKGLHLGYEGTVVSGTPIFGLVDSCLQGNDIVEIKGILNGTTNYILCEMEKGLSYEIALKQAQEAGYAEAVPDNDVLGYDALAKTAMLANVVMGTELNLKEVPCSGITEITSEDIDSGLKEGFRYKLIASLKKEGDSVDASVGLQKLLLSDPLAGVSGPSNAVTFVCDLLGETTIVGPGAGKEATGFALLKDLIDIAKLDA